MFHYVNISYVRCSLNGKYYGNIVNIANKSSLPIYILIIISKII